MQPRSAPRNPIESPDCPECGCNATELLRAGMRWGRPWALFGCDHCGHEFGLGSRPRNADGAIVNRVPFPRLACPTCGSKKTKTASSPKENSAGVKDRYHKCLECDAGFWSYEEAD